MSQKTLIFSFLLKKSPKKYSSKQISNYLKLNPTSTRGRLSQLHTEGKINRELIRKFKIGRKQAKYFIKKPRKIKPKIEKLEYFTKILKTGGSNKHDKKIVASTYETQENPERFLELKKAIMDFANLYRLQTRDLGYQRKKVSNQPVKIPEFPDIEVHTEF